MPDATALPVRRSLWILGPSQDLIWFILTPLFVVPIVLGLKQRVPVETLGALILGFGGFGHHLPGFIRAYSDPALFQRHKARFTIIPLLLLAASAAFSYLNLNAMACATVRTTSGECSMPILTASTPMSSITDCNCALRKGGGTA